MTTLYKKAGRRYVPVGEFDNEAVDHLPYGYHMIVVRKGSRSTHYNIDPNLAALTAAATVADEAMVTAMVKASEYKPSRTPLTPRQIRAWDELKAAFSDELAGLTRDSARDIVQAGIKAMQEEAQRRMTNPVVREAYEQFQTVCKLAE
jgi:hypothetical protein